jgi:hypothetical protein
LGEKQRTRFAVKWILEACDSKPGKTLEERLAREVIAVLEGNSRALAKKLELHRTAMINRYVSEYAHPLPVIEPFPGVMCLALEASVTGPVNTLGSPSFGWAVSHDSFKTADIFGTKGIKIYSKYNNESEMIDWKRKLMKSPFGLRKTGGMAMTS